MVELAAAFGAVEGVLVRGGGELGVAVCAVSCVSFPCHHFMRKEVVKGDVPEIEETLVPAFSGELFFLGGPGGAPAALALLRAAAEEHWAVRGAFAAGLGPGGGAGGVGGGRGGGEGGC